MGQTVALTGMVLSAVPVGEYDKRIVLLTKERGKISAFARGARRPGSQVMAASNPFAFGQFEAYEGRSSYTVVKAEISNYFRELAQDLESAYYGFYFMELADYYSRENADEAPMLKLLYQSLRALESKSLENRLVRRIFELRAFVVNGEYPNVFSCLNCKKEADLKYFHVRRGGTLCRECGAGEHAFALDESTLYTLQYIISVRIEKLYTFTVSKQVLEKLEQIMNDYMAFYIDRKFHALQVLEENEGFAASLAEKSAVAINR
ncbi:MAG: DNA repair protein RecO [Lachnospiraceae bacterium]|nr:DNA repair protein RecO [Lachnospiraceae bacterium]